MLKERLEDVKKERDGYIAFERKYKGVEGGGRKGKEEVEGLRKRLEEVSLSRRRRLRLCFAFHRFLLS